MGSVGGAAAVAEYKNLPVFLKHRADFFDEPYDSVHRDGIVGSLLGLEVIRNPLFHGLMQGESGQFKNSVLSTSLPKAWHRDRGLGRSREPEAAETPAPGGFELSSSHASIATLIDSKSIPEPPLTSSHKIGR